MLNTDGCEDSDHIKRVHCDYFANSSYLLAVCSRSPPVQLYPEMDPNYNTSVFEHLIPEKTRGREQ